MRFPAEILCNLHLALAIIDACARARALALASAIPPATYALGSHPNWPVLGGLNVYSWVWTTSQTIRFRSASCACRSGVGGLNPLRSLGFSKKSRNSNPSLLEASNNFIRRACQPSTDSSIIRCRTASAWVFFSASATSLSRLEIRHQLVTHTCG